MSWIKEFLAEESLVIVRNSSPKKPVSLLLAICQWTVGCLLADCGLSAN